MITGYLLNMLTAMHIYPEVIAIVLTWNGEKWISRCLDSLSRTDYPNLKIIVVDNGSDDDTAAIVLKQFPSVQLTKLKKNTGYAKGNNTGIKVALDSNAKYMAVLNQDIWFEQDWLTHLILVAERNPDIGIVSPQQLEYNGDDLDPRFREVMKVYKEQEIIEVDTIIGAAFIVRREVFEQVGLFDPIYFSYGEEADLCRRVKNNNWRLIVVSKARIHHHHGLLNPENMPLKIKLISLRNSFIYRLKDYENGALHNLHECFKLLVRQLLRIARHERGFKGGLELGAGLLWGLCWIFLNYPRIMYHRWQDSNTIPYV